MSEQVVCLRCGSVDDYRTETAGPHIKAVCNGCDRYIKFLKQHKMSETKNDNLLPGGMRFFNAAVGTPDFVIGTCVVSLNEFFEYCKANPQLQTEYEGKKQLKIQLLVSKAGKLYGKVDDYKKEDVPAGKPVVKPGTAPAAAASSQTPAEEVSADDLPF